MKFCGVDNGLSGAVALYDSTTGEVQIEDAQLDHMRELNCHWIFELLSRWEPDYAIIEQCHNNNPLVERGGYYVAICRLLEIPITKVAARRWMKAMLNKTTKDKQLSVSKCTELLPNADLDRPTPKGKKVSLDHNRADAALLSLYLSQTVNAS